MVCACLNANESSRMAVCSTYFYITKPWLSKRVFLQGYLAISVHGEVATHKCRRLEREKKCPFS